jgi:hypothetical protein
VTCTSVVYSREIVFFLPAEQWESHCSCQGSHFTWRLSFEWHPGNDVMPYSVLLWIPGKMGEPVFVTSSEWRNNPSKCGSTHSSPSGRGIFTTLSDLGHTCLTWLLLCGDSMCMCTSRSTFLHILLAKMFCWSLWGITGHPRLLTAVVGINILAFLFGSFSWPCYVILNPCDQLNYSYCLGFSGISTVLCGMSQQCGVNNECTHSLELLWNVLFSVSLSNLHWTHNILGLC